LSQDSDDLIEQIVGSAEDQPGVAQTRGDGRAATLAGVEARQ
jgi:hypothetical protein